MSVLPAGLEPATFALLARRSNRLSYGSPDDCDTLAFDYHSSIRRVAVQSTHILPCTSDVQCVVRYNGGVQCNSKTMHLLKTATHRRLSGRNGGRIPQCANDSTDTSPVLIQTAPGKPAMSSLHGEIRAEVTGSHASHTLSTNLAWISLLQLHNFVEIDCDLVYSHDFRFPDPIIRSGES